MTKRKTIAKLHFGLFGGVAEQLQETCVVVGGSGHVGLPLALALADAGWETTSLHFNTAVVKTFNSWVMSFLKVGAEEVLSRIQEFQSPPVSDDATFLNRTCVVIVVFGTPVDDDVKPDPNGVVSSITELIPYLYDSQLLILGSTLCSGITSRDELLVTLKFSPVWWRLR